MTLKKHNILIHAINWIWFWHIKRTLIIAKELRNKNYIWDIIFVSNSINPFLINNEWFKFEKLDYGIEDTIKWINFSTYENENFKKFNEIINNHKIDIVIHDTYFLNILVNNRRDLYHFLILRNWDLDYYRSLSNYLYNFKQIYLPNLKKEYSEEKINFLKKYWNCVFVNYIVEKNINKIKEKKLIISPWYWGDYENVIIFFKYVNKLIKTNIDILNNYEIIFILWKHYEKIVEKISFLENVKLKKFLENLNKELSITDFFIGRWWYNTLNEIVQNNCKSLIFPVTTIKESQSDRLDFFINQLWINKIKEWTYNLENDTKNLIYLLNNNLVKNNNLWSIFDWAKILVKNFEKIIFKKNILVFKHIFLPKSENFIYEELRLLEKVKPIIFTLKNENTDLFRNNFIIHYSSDFSELLDFNYPKIKNKELYIKFLKYLVFLIKKYDIKTIYTEFLFDSYFITKIKSLLPDIRIISASRWYDVYSFLKNHIDFIKNIDKILVRDERMKEEIISKLNPFHLVKKEENTKKIEIVKSVLDFKKYKFLKKDFNKLNIIFWWRFVEKKWILEVLDLIKFLSLQNFVWKITLFWDGILKENILDKINKLWLKNRIEYLWFLEHSDLLEVLRKNNCYINYSKVSENGDCDWIPNLILENMLCWNIVFSTIVWWIGEIIKDNITWILLIRNIEKDFENIKNKKNNYYKIVKNWIKLIKNNFSYNNSILKLEKILQ